MNLFFKRLFGKMMTAEKFETKVAQLQADAKRYREVEASAEYKELKELEQVVSEPRFQATKKEYLTKKYNETVEYKNYTEYKKLQGDKAVKAYLQALNDEERAKYEGSMAVKNFLQLKAIVDEAGFESKRLFWQDKNRYKQTEEFKKEARLEELKKSADMQFLAKADVKAIEAFEAWRETYKAPFHSNSIKENLVQTGFWFKQAGLKRDFSYVEEAQAFMGERNVSIMNDALSIVMKKEHAEAAAWDSKKGFHMHEFDYTSAIVNTGDSFKQANGIFAAKVRATGKCHSALYLVGENRFPVIEMFHFNGKNIEVGVCDGKTKNVEVLKSLPASEWNIIEVLVEQYELVWKVNGYEVFRAKNLLSRENLYFSAQCFAPKANGAEGQLDIDWLRAFEH